MAWTIRGSTAPAKNSPPLMRRSAARRVASPCGYATASPCWRTGCPPGRCPPLPAGSSAFPRDGRSQSPWRRFSALASPVSMLKDAIADRVNHRRTVAPASPPGPVTPDDPDPAAELIMMLRSVRDGLSRRNARLSGAHRFGFVAHSAAGFDWLRRHDRHLFEVSLADRLACQAIDSIEIWRGRVAPEPAARWRILSLTAEPVKAIDAELHECAESAELAAVGRAACRTGRSAPHPGGHRSPGVGRRHASFCRGSP